MSVFTPFTRYQVALPFLKPGNLIKVGKEFYMVITVRHNRKTVAATGALTKTGLNQTVSNAYESLTGNLQKNRIVHLQYVAIDTGNTPELFWGTQPLSSKDVDDTISTTTAGLTSPIAIDRWSFDTSMYLSITQTATQNYYFEVAEYEIVLFGGTPTGTYWQILANGQALEIADAAIAAFVESQKFGAAK